MLTSHKTGLAAAGFHRCILKQTRPWLRRLPRNAELEVYYFMLYILLVFVTNNLCVYAVGTNCLSVRLSLNHGVSQSVTGEITLPHARHSCLCQLLSAFVGKVFFICRCIRFELKQLDVCWLLYFKKICYTQKQIGWHSFVIVQLCVKRKTAAVIIGLSIPLTHCLAQEWKMQELSTLISVKLNIQRCFLILCLALVGQFGDVLPSQSLGLVLKD